MSVQSGGSRQVLRSTVLLAASRILERASGFVLSLFIAPKLGASGLGTYAAAMAIYGLLAIASDAGTTNFLVREISRDRARTSTYIVHLSVVAIAVSMVLMGLAQLVTPHLGFAPELETSISVILLAILPKVLNGIQEAAFVSYGRVEFETLTRLVSTLSYIAIGVWLLAQGHGVPSLLRTYVAIEYVVAAVYFVLINRYIARLRLQFGWSLAVRLLNEMKAFAGSTALAAFFARPEIVILSLMASTKEVGYYSAAIRIAELPLFVPSVFMLAVFPLLSQAYGRDEPRFRELQTRAIRYMLAFSLPFAALILVEADRIVPGLYGESLEPAIDLLRILGLNVVLFSVIEVLWRSLAARGRQGVVLRVQLLLVVTRLGGGALLIAPLAALGAAISTAANSVLHLALLARGAARSGAPARILGVARRFALAAAAMGAVAWSLSPLLPLWVLLPVGLLIYAAFALLLGAVTDEDRQLLRRLRASTAR